VNTFCREKSDLMNAVSSTRNADVTLKAWILIKYLANLTRVKNAQTITKNEDIIERYSKICPIVDVNFYLHLSRFFAA